MKYSIRYRASLCFLSLCTLGFLAFAGLAQAEARTVRIGFYEDGDYMSKNSDGEYVGFNIEFLQEISKYTGWIYEIVDGKSWENTLAMLQAGAIDLLPAVYKTPERAERFALSAAPMCNTFTTLNVRLNDTRYDYESFKDFNGMKVGIIKDSVDGNNFIDYCATHNIKAHIIPYSLTDDLIADLEDGTLDGIAITHLGRNSAFRSVAQLAPQPLYILVPKDNPALLAELNSAMSIIKIRNPNYDSRLHDKYFSTSNSQPPAFTKEERAFIQESDVIPVSYDSTWIPLSYTNTKTGAFSGIVADLFESITQTSGLRFRFEPSNGFPENRQRKIVACIASDYLWNKKNSLNATQYYLRTPVVMISKDTTREIKKIAMQRGYLLTEKILKERPGQIIQYYSSPQECFEALQNGDVDATYVNTHIADYLLSNTNHAGFAMTMLATHAEELSIGIPNTADPRLFSILDKCVQYTASEKMNDLILKNTLISHSLSWQKILRQNSVEIVIGMILFFSILTLLLVFLLLMKSRHNQSIKKILYRDELTGLRNLEKFRIDMLGRIRNAKNEYALIYIDIKQFRTINDTFGFAEGDMILQAFAHILERSLTQDELCARVSADQFTLLLRYEDWETLTARTEDLDAQLNAWVRQQSRHYRLILIFGVYVTNPSDKNDIALMLDFASYAKRNAGITHKSRTILYDQHMREEGLLQRTLADRMQNALKQGEFIPYFQPKIDMPTGRLVGCEALVRWNYPGRGILAPGQFLPFFEKNGFIVEIDLYIYEEICKALRSWTDRGMQVLPVSCNFSRLHFKDPSLPERLVDIAATYGIPHEYLEMEVTESVFFGNLNQVLQLFDNLRSRGFPISIDDFGSGYSSLGLLQQFTVDVMKLDRSFIQEGMSGERAQTVVRGAIQMAKDLNMKVICEGVEELEQAQTLMSMGCFTAQGFYYAKPMPLHEYEEWLQKN